MIFLVISFSFCSAGGSHRQCSCNPQKYRLFICFFFFLRLTRRGFGETQWRIQGWGLGAAAPPPPPNLVFRPNWGPRGRKQNSFWGQGPSYRKVWIRHWDLGYVKKEPDEFSTGWKIWPDTEPFNIFAVLTRSSRTSLRILIISVVFPSTHGQIPPSSEIQYGVSQLS